MTIKQKIGMALAFAQINQAELANLMGENNRVNLNIKINKDTLKTEELEQIAEILGGKWVTGFIFEDADADFYARQDAATNIEQKINLALEYLHIRPAELARRLSMSQSNLAAKINRNTFRINDMERIAEALGGTWRAEFVFRDGDKEVII